MDKLVVKCPALQYRLLFKSNKVEILVLKKGAK